MRYTVALLLAALAACVIVFGRSLFGGYFVVDVTEWLEVYHLSVIYERLGIHLSEGHLPFFFPEFDCGYPAPALWMYGLFYPPHAIFAWLRADQAWSISCALHMAFGALGMYVWLRRVLGCAAGAMTAALLYAFSEFTIGRAAGGHLNLICPLAWAPWAMLAARRCARGRPGAVPLLGLTLGLGLISGHAQMWFYLGPLLLLYAVLECRERPASRIRAAGLMAAGLALAAGVSAIQWIANAEFLATTGSPPEVETLLADLSVPFHELGGKVFPGFWGHLPDSGEGGTYWAGRAFHNEAVAIGGLPVIFLVVAGLLGRGRGRWLWLGAAIAGLVVACGRTNPVSAWITDLPVLSWGRATGRALILTVLGVSVLAGRGVAAWLSGSRGLSGRRLLLATALTAGIAGVGAVVLLDWTSANLYDRVHFLERLATTSEPAILRGLAGLAVVLAAFLLVRWRRVLAPGCGVAVAAAAIWAGAPPVETARSDFYFHDWSADHPEEVLEHRVQVAGEMFPNLDRVGVRGKRQMSPVDVPWYMAVLEAQRLELLYWLDLRLMLNSLERSEVFAGPPWPKADTGFEMPACGRAQLFHAAEVEADDEVAISLLATGARMLILNRACPLPTDEPHEPLPRRDQVDLFDQPDPNRVEFRVETTRPGWLYVSEKYYPNWRATVGGEDAACVRANVFGIAVPVPAGDHRVELEFTTAAKSIGLPVSLVTVVLCTVALLSRRRRRSKEAA